MRGTAGAALAREGDETENDRRDGRRAGHGAGSHGVRSTGNLSSNSTSSAGTTSSVSFGSANQQLCLSAGNTKPGYPDTIGTIAGGAKTLTGAGSTFVAPMMDDWIKAYSQATGVQVTYDSIGSGGGVEQI
jgi:ABC-type phosphate transport system substrate-binding protein